MKILNLNKQYKIKNGDAVQALKEVSFELPETGMVFLLGKSGSGKSTLLKVLAGLEVASEGEILFRGKDITKLTSKEMDFYRNNHCGFIFQEYNLLPEFNVGENISLALEMQGERQTSEKVKDVLEKVELSGYEKRRITELSGGQKQRVAIARALIKEPEIIFADEPTGALDSETGDNVLSVLKKLSKENLILVVTHDREITEKYADRVIELADGEIVSDSAPTPTVKKEKEFTLRKTKLPFMSAFRIGLNYFKHHPIRLFITLLLSVTVFTVFGLFSSLVFANMRSVAIDSVIRTQTQYAVLYKYERKEEEDWPSAITEEDYSKITEQYHFSALKLLQAANWGRYRIEELWSYDFSAYYSYDPSVAVCLEGEELNKIAAEIIGKYPTEADEIMITAYTADRFIAAGIVSTRAELIGRTLTIDAEKYTITGIADTNFNGEKFESLKELTYEEASQLSLTVELIWTMRQSCHNLLFLSRKGFAAWEGSDSFVYSGLLIPLDGMSRREMKALFEFDDGENYYYELDCWVINQVRNSIMTLVEDYWIALTILCGIIGVFAVLLFVYMISQSIEEKTGTIAMLRTMGASKNAVRKIFLIEGLFVGLITLILSLALMGIFGTIFNGVISETVPILAFGLRLQEISLLTGVVLLFSVIGVVIPIGRIKDKKLMRYMG